MLQPGSDLSQAVTSNILFKYPTHYFGFLEIHRQFTIGTNFISIAFAASHLRTAILEAFPKASLNCIAFLYHIH